MPKSRVQRDPENRDPESNITARPRSPAEDLTTRPIAEPGLSVDPEDLGSQFLREATEQDNFESLEGGDTPELSITGNPPSDEPLTGPTFEPDLDVWESSVDLTLESGGSDEARASASREGTEQNQGLPYESLEMDLSGESVSDGSLLDEEGDELGEVESPDLNTDLNAKDRPMRVRHARTRHHGPSRP